MPALQLALEVSDMLNLDNLLMTIIINHELNTRNFLVVFQILKLYRKR